MCFQLCEDNSIWKRLFASSCLPYFVTPGLMEIVEEKGWKTFYIIVKRIAVSCPCLLVYRVYCSYGNCTFLNKSWLLLGYITCIITLLPVRTTLISTLVQTWTGFLISLFGTWTTFTIFFWRNRQNLLLNCIGFNRDNLHKFVLVQLG